MNESEVIDLLCEYISSQFPKECNCCGKRFNSLSDYLKNTTHIGKPASIDAEAGNWQPLKPIGTFSMANCKFGSTLVITSKNMKLIKLLKLMN